jgi:predicted ATP-grasp superfamily ATP-dependent carboligase
MLKLSKHIAKRPVRSIISTVLSVIYLMISFSPLALIAMHSKTVVHAITGECSGDCNICGCSPESRASNTCCCSKKRKQEAHTHEDEDATPDCCKKKSVGKKTVIASCGCPCGSGKTMALTGGSTGDIIPYYFTDQIVLSHTETHYSDLSSLLISRHVEPLDPPPKQA